jgi:hypothetical protein
LSISEGKFEPEDKDSNENLLILFSRLRADGFISAEREKLLAGQLKAVDTFYSKAEDFEKIERAAIVGQITSALSDPISSEKREWRESFVGRDYARSYWHEGAAAGERAAEATLLVAGLLGTPTSKGDIVLMAGVPIGGMVLSKAVKISKALLGKVIKATLGKSGQEAINAALSIKGVKAIHFLMDENGLPLQLWMNEKVKIGPAFKTLEEAMAAANGGHHLEVILKNKEGKVVGNWFEASEKGLEQHLGHTEQKALMRLSPEFGMSVEMRGAYPPCPYQKNIGCQSALQDAADFWGITITYQENNGAVRTFQPFAD